MRKAHCILALGFFNALQTTEGEALAVELCAHPLSDLQVHKMVLPVQKR